MLVADCSGKEKGKKRCYRETREKDVDIFESKNRINKFIR